jgi:hypothetical protein
MSPDRLREFAAREAQHAPAQRPEKPMRRCPRCRGLFVLVAGDEQTCASCTVWPGVGAGQ